MVRLFSVLNVNIMFMLKSIQRLLLSRLQLLPTFIQHLTQLQHSQHQLVSSAAGSKHYDTINGHMLVGQFNSFQFFVSHITQHGPSQTC